MFALPCLGGEALPAKVLLGCLPGGQDRNDLQPG